jgi:hypothetical protein
MTLSLLVKKRKTDWIIKTSSGHETSLSGSRLDWRMDSQINVECKSERMQYEMTAEDNREQIECQDRE